MIAVVASIVVSRIVLIVLSLGLWHWTQKLLARRNPVVDSGPASSAQMIGLPVDLAILTEANAGGQATLNIADGLHTLTARLNQRLLDNPGRANALLIASSLVIDLLGIYLLVSAIIGPTIAPFLGLFMVFGLRQVCQAFCPLPPPTGMIWRNPGCPSLLVTYGTSCDLFFSGHTAIAVYGCATLADALGPVGIVIGSAIVAFEIGAVLVLRAHYTMDVFTGALAALYVHRLAIEYSPVIDQWIRHAVS